MNKGLTRREMLVGLAAASAGFGGARAQGAWPQRQIRLVVGYPAGQTVDVTARAYADAIGRLLGKAVFVDNKAGANGIIGAQAVKSAEADGYTLLMGTSGQMTINPAIYAKLPYDTSRDFVPVASGANGRLYLVVNRDFPADDLKQLIAWAKAHPGKLTYGSGGAGITAHLAMEMLKSETGMDALHVPYKGSPAAVTGLLAGDVQVMFDAGALLLPLIKSGKVKVLAVSSKARYDEMPKVPTVAEQGFPAFEITSWTALFAPAGTAPAIVERLNAAMRAASKDPAAMTAVRAGGSEPGHLDVAQMRAFMAAETARWKKAADAAGVKPE
ncbi:Bug family tripartite tricarboxylate transporter substrate binding protein [Variovorax paradoxus]|uniref:Bug family tripartite tricarboxylate transporter substrate binding protein n=1 Tax=Variovorax paradoxus TaxID=34073 RepID=UPI0029C6EF10|nr:tripartite tricarboxylate transporter substrate binding protein [Variovorax paradoxus]